VGLAGDAFDARIVRNLVSLVWERARLRAR
jgi:hypothetical protein